VHDLRDARERGERAGDESHRRRIDRHPRTSQGADNILRPFLAASALAVSLAASAAPAADSASNLSPTHVLGLIRARFRSHRPPPPYVTYTIVRSQLTDTGYPDYVGSYTYHVWCRSSDRAALQRKVFRDLARGPLEFARPAFNEPRDPGPPTADLFEPAPAHPHPIEFVPTPEAAPPLPVIGTVRVVNEFEYRVASMDERGGLVHLRLEPIRDPERNRLRELWADRKSYELRRLVATDRLFVTGSATRTYPVTFTINLAMLEGHPVVTDIHGVVGDNYADDGKEVDFKFRDIAFPAGLPDWYFNTKTYKDKVAEAPL
jgi:hypothetical protein